MAEKAGTMLTTLLTVNVSKPYKIAVHFKLNHKTVYYHVMKLIVEGRLRQERGKLVVVGSEWIEPSGWPVQRFDF
jgi:hypothetical protein